VLPLDRVVSPLPGSFLDAGGVSLQEWTDVER
jgi:hypothetical protein